MIAPESFLPYRVPTTSIYGVSKHAAVSCAHSPIFSSNAPTTVSARDAAAATRKPIQCIPGCALIPEHRPRTSNTKSKPHRPRPHPPQTLAAQFKRPYRNCPDREDSRPPTRLRSGSPDRVLTFIGTNRAKLFPNRSSSARKMPDRRSDPGAVAVPAAELFIRSAWSLGALRHSFS